MFNYIIIPSGLIVFQNGMEEGEELTPNFINSFL